MYVFGIDLPIMELLFLFTVFLLIALIVIWIEIRKLRRLILKEKANIYEFEEDINKLKPKEKQKHFKNLDAFIQAASKEGLTKDKIKTILLNKGWPKGIVGKALDKIK